MKATLNRGALLAVMGAVMLFAAQAQAITTVNTFDNFTSDALYPSWALPASTIVSGPTSYDVTASGYGSNYKYIGFPQINGAGNHLVQLTVNLSGPPAADGMLGPIITLEDNDGTANNYAWYGQLLGPHVLTMPLNSPTFVGNPGGTPGLDLANLTQMHMQLDPSGFGGQYTIQWQDLSLTVPEPGSVALAACGLGLLAGIRRRRRG